MANTRITGLFRPWKAGATNELETDRITDHDRRTENPSPIFARSQRCNGYLPSNFVDKENDSTSTRHREGDSMLQVAQDDQLLTVTGYGGQIMSDKCSPCGSVPRNTSRCKSDTSAPASCSNCVSSSSGVTSCCANVPFPFSTSNLPIAWTSASYPEEYLHQTRLLHTMAYPPMDVSSVMWPMEIASSTSLVHSLGQSLYSGLSGYPRDNVSINYAAGMIQKQDEIMKTAKTKMRPKRFRCEHCDVAFSNNGQLKGHVRIHTGERPFKCDEKGCEKSFTRNEELTRHKRIHTGVRPHACLVCGKRFGRKDHLKKHTRTHENRDLYATSAASIGIYAVGHAAPPFPPYVFHI